MPDDFDRSGAGELFGVMGCLIVLKLKVQGE